MVNRHVYFDTATLYYRAFYAVPESIKAPDGTPNGAVRSFFEMTSTLLKTYPPQDLVFAWDDDWRPNWRVKLVPTYKTHRVEDTEAGTEEVPDLLSPQIGAISDILDAIGLARIGARGHEADDILGSLVHQRTGPMDVITGDRDLFQLVNDDDDVRVISITKGMKNLEHIDDAFLVNKYGVTGRQYVDFATLRGDASDGLPGVKGVGEKTAAALIGQFSDLAQLVVAAEADHPDIKAGVKQKLVEHKSYIAKAQQVVTVRKDAKLPASLAVPTKIKKAKDLDFLIADWGVDRQVGRLLKTLNIG